MVYLYDGTFEGLLTSVYYSYYTKPHAQKIYNINDYEPNFLDETKIILIKGNDIKSIPYKVQEFTATGISTNGEVVLLNSNNKLVFIDINTQQVIGTHNQDFIKYFCIKRNSTLKSWVPLLLI